MSHLHSKHPPHRPHNLGFFSFLNHGHEPVSSSTDHNNFSCLQPQVQAIGTISKKAQMRRTVLSPAKTIIRPFTVGVSSRNSGPGNTALGERIQLWTVKQEAQLLRKTSLTGWQNNRAKQNPSRKSREGRVSAWTSWRLVQWLIFQMVCPYGIHACMGALHWARPCPCREQLTETPEF